MTLGTRKHWASLAAALAMFAGCEIGVEGTPDPSTQISAPATELLSEPQAPRVAQGHLQFVQGYRQGLAQATQQSKPMLLFFTAEWCQFCHQMADEAFTHPQVVSLSQQFVCVLVDADGEADVCRQFAVAGYPTIQFLSSRGAPLVRIVGKKPGHQVTMAMQAALQNVARRSETTEGAPSR